MNALKTSSPQRTRQILEDLEAVRENLLALSDDIWESIDRQDLAAFDEGVRFMRTFIEKMSAFDHLATDLSATLQQFTNVQIATDEVSGGDDRAKNERIILELNREEPHSLDENLTWKRPHGFILQGQAASGISTWRRVFELICQHLHRRDSTRFISLIDNPDFISNRGHRSFTRSPDELRSAGLVADGIYAEINLSANALRDVIRRMLTAYEISTSSLQLFLREDRDASHESEA
jgi:hypothetical protein